MILANLNRLFFGTLRRQLIIGVAAVHALMMALFIIDLTWRQEAFLLDRQAEQATALAHSLATSASGWLAAHDISGLQELAESQRRYPELQFAMLLDNKGQVLAHTDRSRLGQYVRDLPAQVRQTTVGRSPALVDVLVPAMLANRHVGWARVGIGQHLAGQRLAEITRNGVLYALAAILTGSLLAWFMGRRLTRRLYTIRSAMDEVRSGNSRARARLSGIDEAADLAAGFNTMLDAMTGLNTELHDSEERFRSLFENSPVSIWEEDFSEVKKVLDSLKEQGVDDIETYLSLHPEIVQQCAGAARVVDINLATLQLHEATDKAELLTGLANTFTPESYSTFREELIALWHGKTVLVRDAVVKTLAGTPREVTLYFSVCPRHERSHSRVMVSLVDITERKQAEKALEISEERFRNLVETTTDWVWEVDRNGVYTYASPAVRNMLGYEPEDLLGKTPFDLMPAEEAKRVAEIFGPLVVEHKPIDYLENINQHKDGRQVILETCGIPFFDPNGIFKGYRGVDRDITERKQAEEELIKYRENLEELVKTRTAEIEQKSAEIEKMNKLFVGRELRMVELKDKIRALEEKLGARMQ